MKKSEIKIYYSFIGNRIRCIWIVVFLLFASLLSCNEEEFLSETPLDFYSPENSFVTFQDYEAAICNLHSKFRRNMWGGGSYGRLYWYGTDLILSVYDLLGSGYDYEAREGATAEKPTLWNCWWELIYDANVIIERSGNDQNKLTADEKIQVSAEARFFRAYCYNQLANTFGGMPLVLEETKSARRDYVRSTRQETYEQCALDLEFAAEHLKDIEEVDESRINNLAASHVLAEVYISLGRWQDAIDEASKVIDHPGTDLMTERFGNKALDPELFGFFDANFDDPENFGDVYWDLFYPGNQNRSIGNKESIWVLQYAYNVPGGGTDEYVLERWAAPDLTKAQIIQSDGKLSPILKYPNTYYCGRGQGFCMPSPYFLKTLWEKSGYYQDIRNSKYNIIRDIKVNNPANEYNGKWIIADNLPRQKKFAEDTTRYFYPILGKIISPGLHPKDFWLADQTIPGSLTGDAQQTWRNHYQIRLAETYLLRAEAYLGNGEIQKAVDDINVVRRRAKAPDASVADIDINYILDERMRELYYENHWRPTISRLDMRVERTRSLNPISGRTVKDHMNLYAIPYSEINKNVEAPLEQNPGW